MCGEGVCLSAQACEARGVVCELSCCDAPDSCIEGACCAERDTCGDQCCGAGERCLPGFDCCPVMRDCGAICCGVAELCDGGVCRPDCGGVPGCGPSGACCEPGAACFAGECVTLGAVCGRDACLGRGQGSCPSGQLCDPALSRCVPRLEDATCIYVPPARLFDPVPRLSWGARLPRTCAADSQCQRAERCVSGSCSLTWTHVQPTSSPEHFQVTSIPIVADLDGDCIPEIIFNSYRQSTYTRNGVLRAIHGTDGSEVFSVTDAEYQTNGTSNPAVGDLDGDGHLEIVTDSETDGVLLLFDATGAPIWKSDRLAEPTRSGSPAIANFDADGHAEIAYGSAILDSSGAVRFEGEKGWIDDQGPISCAADLDGDGRPELISGNTAYGFTGRISDGSFAGRELWTLTSSAGYCGIGDLDGDHKPEVVFVGQRELRVTDAAGVLIATHEVPGRGHGGAPNLADFDGDGWPEIGVAGSRSYAVFKLNGKTLEVLWTAVTEDNSSQRTGSSVFDFDGDGLVEVVYNDEEYLRIYPGVEPDCLLTPPGPACDGLMTASEVLFQDLNSSRTRTEYPVIADVDGDFKAEIIFSTSNEADFLDPLLASDAGIEVWKDRLDNWVPTRSIWNQNTYHVTNVNDDGSIPITEPDSWTHGANGYRINTQGTREFCAPDLRISEAFADATACPDLRLIGWVTNRGCLGVGAGVALSAYVGSTLIASARTANPLPPGASERVVLTAPGPVGTPISFFVDSEGDVSRVSECSETNNRFDVPSPCPSP